MRYLLLFLFCLPAHAKLACEKDENFSVVDIRTETGCVSGIVIENVETACVDPSSPAIASLQAGRKYEICNVSVLDPSKTTWLAHIKKAAEVKLSTAARDELNSAVSNVNGSTLGGIQGLVTVPGLRKSPAAKY